MLEFSASKATKGKVAYKGYVPVKVPSFAELAEYGRDHSMSSLFYGKGVTEGGEQCEGHRAFGSATGAGNVLFGDFDNKGATLDDLRRALESVGAGGWIGPSKSCDIEAGVYKFHLAVAFDRPLPMDKEAFELLYKATMQFLGLTQWYDPCMHGVTQQIAPHWKDNWGDVVLDGAVLDMGEVMVSYVAPQVQAKETGRALGEVEPGTQFTLSRDDTKVSIKEMIDLVSGGRKVRVHCLAGLQHDGRNDTALVRGSEDGSAFYHCTGGRCGHTLVLRDPAPFEALQTDEADEEVPVRVSASMSVWQMANNAMDIIQEAPEHIAAFEPKAKDKQREQAAAWVAQRIFELADIRIVEGRMCWFSGTQWEGVFAYENEMFTWAQSVFRNLGFGSLASNLSCVTAVIGVVKKSVKEAKVNSVGNMINVRNGMFNLDTMRLEAHDREQLFCATLPFAFDPMARAPQWDGFIDRIMLGSDKLKMSLQDAIGYLFCRNLHLEVMVGFVGEGANGKTTLMNVISALIGPRGVSYVPLQTLCKPTGDGLYARAELAGRMVNFTGELSPKTIEATEFKNLITGTNIVAREPFGKQFTLSSVPKQVCAMNTTDSLIKERSHGFMRRLWLIPFKYTVAQDERDVNLDKKLAAELPGIFNWVMEGAKRVMANSRITSSAEMVMLLENIKLDANPVQQFLEERTEEWKIEMDKVEPRNKLDVMTVGVTEVYQKYKEFCEINSNKPLGRNNFSREVERLGRQKVNLTIFVNGAATKASGFYLKLLEPKDWKEPGVRTPLELLTKPAQEPV